MISHRCLQSVHSVEHFKGCLKAPTRHPSSYAFSIKTTNFGSPLSELKTIETKFFTPHNTIENIEDAIMNQSVHSVEHFKGYLNAPISKTSKKNYLWHFADPKPWINRLTAKHVNAWYMQSTTHHINWKLYLQ